MAIIAPITDGEVQETSASSTSTSTSSTGDNSSLDKEAFLQLLVTQMQYQDPLEPTSNTEYISQLATFSELEAMQNLDDTQTVTMANGLVGENVIMKVTSSSTGDTSYVNGVVDYVVIESGVPYLSINNSLYSIDDLDTVVSSDYLDAYNDAADVTDEIENLPTSTLLTLSDKEAVEAARTSYEELSEYAKEFVGSDTLSTLEELEELIAQYEG